MGDIGWYRDLIICIAGTLISIAVIFVAVLSYLLYRKTKVVLTTVETTSSLIHQASTAVKDEVIGPLLRFTSLIRGVLEGIDFVAQFFRKKEGESDG